MQWQEQAGVVRSLLMYYGQPWRLPRMRRFYAQFIKPGDLCFDVGAHVGNRLRIWQALGARTIALEPQPHLMRWLQRLYGRQNNIVLLEAAAGAGSGTATLHISSRTPTVTSLSADWISTVQQDPAFSRVRWDRTVNVPVTTLDLLIAEHGAPAFCKIDVEGFELEVLRGLSHALPALSFEYIPATRALAVACIGRIGELGDYTFNYSPGESHRLQSNQWLSPSDMLKVLAGIRAGSGDVYARLAGQLATAPQSRSP